MAGQKEGKQLRYEAMGLLRRVNAFVHAVWEDKYLLALYSEADPCAVHPGLYFQYVTVIFIADGVISVSDGVRPVQKTGEKRRELAHF